MFLIFAKKSVTYVLISYQDKINLNYIRPQTKAHLEYR